MGFSFRAVRRPAIITVNARPAQRGNVRKHECTPGARLSRRSPANVDDIRMEQPKEWSARPRLLAPRVASVARAREAWSIPRGARSTVLSRPGTHADRRQEGAAGGGEGGGPPPGGGGGGGARRGGAAP